MTDKTIEQLKAERRELSRRIRAAQKAEAEAQRKAHEQALLDLGRAAAQALGADGIEQVEVYAKAFREDRILLSNPDSDHEQEPHHEWA